MSQPKRKGTLLWMEDFDASALAVLLVFGTMHVAEARLSKILESVSRSTETRIISQGIALASLRYHRLFSSLQDSCCKRHDCNSYAIPGSFCRADSCRVLDYIDTVYDSVRFTSALQDVARAYTKDHRLPSPPFIPRLPIHGDIVRPCTFPCRRIRAVSIAQIWWDGRRMYPGHGLLICIGIFKHVATRIFDLLALGLIRLETDPIFDVKIVLVEVVANVLEALIPGLDAALLKLDDFFAEATPETALAVTTNVALAAFVFDLFIGQQVVAFQMALEVFLCPE